MTKDSIVFGVAGAFFGLLVGWIIGSHHDRIPVTSAPPAQAASAPAQGAPAQGAMPLDESRAAALKVSAERAPTDAVVRVELANLYFDAERFEDAKQWYEDALRLNPRDANVSTDLGITYYYLNQADRALAQFEKSLAIDPRHSKTLLNMGVVRAYGKQDLQGAARDWQRVVDIAPGTREAEFAKQALDRLKSAHPTVPGETGGAADKPVDKDQGKPLDKDRGKPKGQPG